MTRHRKKPQKSLRTILVTWFLFFSIVPIAVVTIYSLQAYKHSLENVVLQKLEGNKREIIRVFQDLEITLSRSSRRHASQKGLKYYLYRNLKRQIVESAMQWMNSTVIVHKLTIYNRTGGLIVSLSQNSEGKIYRDESLEKGDYFLPKEFLEKFEDTSANRKYIDFSKDNSLQLISFTRIVTDKGRLLGYLEEVVELNKKFFDDIKSKLNVELVIFDKNNFLYSGNQLSMLTPKYLKQLYLEGKSFNKVELGNGENFSFLFSDISWGDQQVVFGVGASNTQSEKTLDSISWALFSMFAAILILLFVLSFIISRLILKPLYSLLDAIQNIDLNSDYIEIPVEVENELGLLTKSFNEMAKELFYSQQILKKNIGELEEANQKIKDTQIQLVHSEKMASLGQLVAGVAHELNNPIGFINSNMVHLKEYSESLIKLINEIEKNPKKIKQLKEDIDFDYLTQDLPKLIKSCEDGSRRTKEIVLGLRSFSRIDEAELKLSDLH
ncbi:MAG: HAMP domain-containing protein, partial [Bdellovibrionales bacterium]|nr:HAMP domain-containing protein [Bdellovibrionales bacterium]